MTDVAMQETNRPKITQVSVTTSLVQTEINPAPIRGEKSL
jgi:hypothetical protein